MSLNFIDEVNEAVSVVKQAYRTEAAFNFKDGHMLKNYPQSWVKVRKLPIGISVLIILA